MAASERAVTPRSFEDRPAVRAATPLLVGLIGPSGAGKTYSGLRMATGIQRVVGGEIFVIDTESKRALHYADKFRFRHLPFAPPFGPLDYLAAIEHCAKKGTKTIMVDSMSHEHEGQGGLLEMHTAEVERIMAAWRCSETVANIPAWAKPKAARRSMINAILQMPINFIFCFRAKDKIKIAKVDGKSVVSQMGFMPIAGEEFVYELTAKSLLLPGANGVPTLTSDQPGEQMMIKIPAQFRGFFSGAAGKPLDEEIGQQMAQWAAGGSAGELAEGYANCADQAAFDALEQRRKEIWSEITAGDKKAIKAASEDAAKRVAGTSVDKATGEVLTLDGTPPDVDAAAIATLEAAFMEGAQTLRAAWAGITADYAARDADVPMAVEAKFMDLRDSVKE